METTERLELLKMATELVKNGISLSDAMNAVGLKYVPQEAQDSDYSKLQPFPDTLSLSEDLKLKISSELVITSVCLCKTKSDDGKEATYYHCNVVPRGLGANSIIDAKLTVFDNTALFDRITAQTQTSAVDWTDEETVILADLESQLTKKTDTKKISVLNKRIATLKAKHEPRLLPIKFITAKDKENWQSLRYQMVELNNPIIIIGRILYKQQINTKAGKKFCTLVRLGCDEIRNSKGVTIVEKYGETVDEALARLAAALENNTIGGGHNMSIGIAAGIMYAITIGGCVFWYASMLWLLHEDKQQEKRIKEREHNRQ
jgi:hypothetical protein